MLNDIVKINKYGHPSLLYEISWIMFSESLYSVLRKIFSLNNYKFHITGTSCMMEDGITKHAFGLHNI